MRDKAPSDHNDHSEPAEVPERAVGADTREAGLEEIDAETLLHRRASPRKRAVQAGLALLCVLVVFGGIPHNYSPAYRSICIDSTSEHEHVTGTYCR